MRLCESLIAVCLLASAACADECVPDRVGLRGTWGEATFAVELAETPRERSLGLMHRESMPKSAGMLFIFDPPQPVAFWMRNTLIPLDMLFIDRAGVVTRIHENAVPHDETAIPSGGPIYAVLEINGGLSDIYGINQGTEVLHPVFGEPAAWPCS